MKELIFCVKRERDTPFCVYKYKRMVRGIEAKKNIGLKETKLLKLGDSCRRRDGTGFIMPSHMQQVPSFWDKIPFNFFFLRSSFFLISLIQGTNLHYFLTLRCLSSLFLVTLLLLQPCHHFYHIQAALRPSMVIWFFLGKQILFLYCCCCCCSYCYCFVVVVVVVDGDLVAVVDAVIGKYHFLVVPLQRLFVYYYYYF